MPTMHLSWLGTNGIHANTHTQTQLHTNTSPIRRHKLSNLDHHTVSYTTDTVRGVTGQRIYILTIMRKTTCADTSNTIAVADTDAHAPTFSTKIKSSHKSRKCLLSCGTTYPGMYPKWALRVPRREIYRDTLIVTVNTHSALTYNQTELPYNTNLA